ncbi:hypothetical protein P7C71_g5267, partial [Lecanoromycetidae sp. Uapishka_2]
MGQTRPPGREKRHLVRWNDDLDKKLLLTVQYECNARHIVLPFDAIGKTMGDGITGGAVIQHLAKLRTRMIADKKSVPPPLRRGGHGSTATGLNTPAATPVKQTRTTARSAPAKPSNTRPTKRKAKSMSAESDVDEDYESSSEVSRGPRTSKRSSNINSGTRKVKKESSDDDIVTASKRGGYVRSVTPATPAKRAAAAYSGDSTVSAEDVNGDRGGNHPHYIAAGAPFLELENEHLKVKLSMNFESGLALLKKIAEANVELESSYDSEDELHDESEAEEEIDGKHDVQGGARVLTQDEAEAEADAEADEDADAEYFDEGRVAGMSAQQHIYVNNLENGQATRAMPAQYPDNGYQANNNVDFPVAEREFQANDYDANNFDGYEKPVMVYGEGFFQDAFHSDDPVVRDDNWMQANPAATNDNNVFAHHDYHVDLPSSGLYIQTDFTPQNGLPTSSNSYYSAGATLDPYSSFSNQSQDHSIQWYQGDGFLGNMDFKPTDNNGFV